MNNNNDKISNLKKKIDSIEKSQQSKSPPKRESGASFGFKISTEIVAALIVGVVIGVLVDNYFGSQPFGLIIFFILGALAGFLNIYRVMRRIENQ